MTRIAAVFMSVITCATLFFGGAGSPDYVKNFNFKEVFDMMLNKNAVISEHHTGKASDCIWDEEKEFTLDETVSLQKEKGKDFKILTLDDIHFSDYGYRAPLSVFSSIAIRGLVASVKPDLIIIPGDFVCAESSFYSIKKITDLMESFGIPWAPVFGNHDDEANCDLNYLADVMTSSPHCLMQKNDPEMGVGNYIINITEDGKIAESIFMMDSHHSQPNEKQQRWFRWAAEGINRITDNGSEISLFMHVPIPEFQYAYDAAYNEQTKKWNDGYGAAGSLHESICCERDGDEPVQRGFFDIIKSVGTAKHVFCAHDHMNDFSIEYDGVRLTYLMKLGKASGYQPGFDGGSVISIGTDGINRITHKTFLLGNHVDISL